MADCNDPRTFVGTPWGAKGNKVFKCFGFGDEALVFGVQGQEQARISHA